MATIIDGIRTFSNDPALVEEKRAEIVRQACKVFITMGYDATSMRDLARAMGKSTGAYYHYFGSKKDILYIILDFTVTNQQEFLKKMQDKVKELAAVEAFKEAIRIYLESFEEFADMHVFVNHVMVTLAKKERQMMLDASQRVNDFFEERLLKGIREGAFRPVNTKMVAHNLVVIGNSWVNRRWYWRKYFTLDEYTREQTNLILQVLRVS
ncbi:MAG: TetR/AcrR family transcriptional regulator, partial [Dehalococcoidia bacterium]|nr:TetR/AcrR family transcriptional regulator [Dehalococcoidia bacterium]